MGQIYICFALIKAFIHKIVTKTEILALVSLQSNINFKRYRPYLGDMTKLVDNLKGPLLTALATINGTVSKIVTKTEILALVSLLLGTYFIWYWPTLGDIQPNNHLLILFQQNRSSSPSSHSVKHFLGSKPPDIVIGMLMYDNLSMKANINSQ